MKKIIFITIAMVLISNLLFSANDNIGTFGFSFLRTDISARANGMAGAYTALSNDVNAVYYNPAGLSLLKNTQISTTFSNYLLGIPIGNLAVSKTINNKNFAFFAQYLTDEQDKTDSNGVMEGKFGNSDLILGLSIAKQIHPVIYIGGSVKYISETLDNSSASAIVMDLGILHQTTNPHLKVGATIKNLGFQLTYYTKDKIKEKMPKTATIGLNYYPTDFINFLLDIEKPFDRNVIGKVGIEYKYNKVIQLRGGYNTDGSSWNNGGSFSFLSGISLGFGLYWHQYSFDYAFKSYGDLGINNQLSLSYTF
jgi:hypothetical protein